MNLNQSLCFQYPYFLFAKIYLKNCKSRQRNLLICQEILKKRVWGPSKMGLKTNPGRCWLFLVTYEVREGFFQNVDCSKDGGDDAGPLWAEMWCYYPFGGCRHILGPRGRWLWHAVGDHEEGWRHFRLPASPAPPSNPKNRCLWMKKQNAQKHVRRRKTNSKPDLNIWEVFLLYKNSQILRHPSSLKICS